MRVLLVTPLLPHPHATTGGALVMHGQLRAMARAHEVVLATFVRPGEEDALDALRAEGHRVVAVPRSDAGGLPGLGRRARLAARWAGSAWPLRALAFSRPDMQRALDGLLAAEDFDLVQVEDSAMGAYAYPAALPAVLTEHDVRHDGPGSPAGPERRREARRWQRHQPAVWRRFAHVQVFTARDAAAARALAPDLTGRLSVNPFGVDLPAEADPAGEEPDAVVFVGGFRHAPNVDAAVWLVEEVLPRLRARRPSVRLRVVGSDPPRRVRALAGPGVEVTGRVPAVEPFLAAAAVVVAPVRTGGGMRVKVLQAMAMGKAVVTTPLGAEGLLLDGGAAPLVTAADADATAAAVAALLGDDGARRALGRHARAFVAARHSWAAYTERLEATYARVRAAHLSPGERP